jgi:hypothetical protein
LVSLLLSLTYLGVFKSPLSETHKKPSISNELVQSADYAMFQQEINGTIYVNEHGFTKGRQLVGDVFVYAPHKLWIAKPGSTGILVAQVEGLSGDWSLTIWTELFIDFGYPELVLAFVLIGYLFAHLDDVFARSSARVAKVIIPMLATYSILLIRGSLQAEIGYGIPLVIMLFACLRRDQVRNNSDGVAAI